MVSAKYRVCEGEALELVDKSNVVMSNSASVCRGVCVARATWLLNAVRLWGECIDCDCEIQLGDLGDVDVAESWDEVGDVDRVERSDEGASNRKLHVSPFLSQFAQLGCVTSHFIRLLLH